VIVSKARGSNSTKYVPLKRTNAGGPKRAAPLLWLGAGAALLLIAGLVILLRQPPSAASQPTLTSPAPSGQAAAAAGQATGPKLVVDHETIDFGTVPMNKPVRAVFRLTNAGDRPLVIEEAPTIVVKQGC
jgi:hypothetical protein